MNLELVALSDPVETREFEQGRFELYRVGPVTIGRATYEPGWRWSEHVGAAAGMASCRSSTSGSCSAGRPRCGWTTAPSA